jgi:hypothetical protein
MVRDESMYSPDLLDVKAGERHRYDSMTAIPG